MKKTLTLVALMAGAVGVYAQGTVVWSDYVSGFSIDVWSPNTQSPGVVQQGNTSTDNPAGTTVYTGVPIGGASTSAGTTATSYGNGDEYTIGLYASTSSATAVSLAGTADLVATSPFYDTGGTGKAGILEGPAFGGGPGYAGGWTANFGVPTPVSLTGTSSGSAGSAQLQLAAWYNDNGTYTSYAAALAAGVPTGYSVVGSLSGLGGANASGPPSTAPNLGAAGITSFSLATVPEPSTIALGIIGASAFLMRLRRKQ